MALPFGFYCIIPTENAQTNAFLDEQVSNGYAILQSSKEAQWADVASKKTVFKEVFLDNQPVGLNDENPLENALNDLKTAENLIMRGKDYREKLDVLAMEFGPPKLVENTPVDLFLWNAEAKYGNRIPMRNRKGSPNSKTRFPT